jgi:hypothetical protein
LPKTARQNFFWQNGLLVTGSLECPPNFQSSEVCDEGGVGQLSIVTRTFQGTQAGCSTHQLNLMC